MMADDGFPILHPKGMLPVPWSVIRPHEAQAVSNHGQSLDRLAARGGLDVVELLAVLEDRPWHRMDTLCAIERLANLVVRSGA